MARNLFKPVESGAAIERRRVLSCLNGPPTRGTRWSGMEMMLLNRAQFGAHFPPRWRGCNAKQITSITFLCRPIYMGEGHSVIVYTVLTALLAINGFCFSESVQKRRKSWWPGARIYLFPVLEEEAEYSLSSFSLPFSIKWSNFKLDFTKNWIAANCDSLIHLCQAETNRGKGRLSQKENWKWEW